MDDLDADPYKKGKVYFDEPGLVEASMLHVQSA